MTASVQPGGAAAEPLIEVVTSLQRDPRSRSGYDWGGGAGPDLVLTAGTGISGTGTVYNGVAVKTGGLIRTTIFINLTGLNVDAATDNIIGKDAATNCHIGQVLAAVQALAGRM